MTLGRAAQSVAAQCRMNGLATVDSFRLSVCPYAHDQL